MAKGTVTIDFGDGSQNASVTVTGQTNILAGSIVQAEVMTAEALGGHTEDAHLMMAEETRFVIYRSSIVPSTSFTIQAFSKQRLFGQYNINWAGDYT